MGEEALLELHADVLLVARDGDVRHEEVFGEVLEGHEREGVEYQQGFE